MPVPMTNSAMKQYATTSAPPPEPALLTSPSSVSRTSCTSWFTRRSGTCRKGAIVSGQAGVLGQQRELSDIGQRTNKLQGDVRDAETLKTTCGCLQVSAQGNAQVALVSSPSAIRIWYAIGELERYDACERSARRCRTALAAPRRN